jgi:hypothetical protein
VPAVLLPLLTAGAFVAGATHAYGAQPKSMWGEAYDHVPMHLVAVAMSLLLSAAVLTVARRAGTPRARRAGHRCAAAWLGVAAAFGLETFGATLGDGYGDNSVHSAAALLLLPTALLLLVSTLLLAGTRGGAGHWTLRLALLTSIPAVPALAEAQSPVALGLGLTAAAVWLAIAAQAAVPLRRPQLVAA